MLFIAQDLTYLPADVHHPIERQLLGDRAICFVASKYAHVDTVIALLPPETVSLGDATATWFDVAIEDCYEDSVPGVCPSHRRLSAMVISGPPPDISRLKFPSAGWFAFELVPVSCTDTTADEKFLRASVRRLLDTRVSVFTDLLAKRKHREYLTTFVAMVTPVRQFGTLRTFTVRGLCDSRGLLAHFRKRKAH